MNLMKRSLILFFMASFLSVANAAKSGKISDAEYERLKKTSPINAFAPRSMIKDAVKANKAMMALFKQGAIPEKQAFLIGLAVSVAMKCEYCIHANKFNAAKAGATEEEIKTAIQISSQVSYFSSLFYGHEMDLGKFRKMVGSMEINKDGSITTSKVTQ